jgi:zinc-ribbon domain
MYCPKCSQPQPDEVRFCSRCGISLSEIAQWLAGTGVLVNEEPLKKQLSPRRRGIIRAAKVTFFSAVFLPVGLIFGMAIREPFPLIIPLIVFAASLVWMLYCRLFMDDTPPYENQLAKPTRMRTGTYLPPLPDNLPSALEPGRVNTAEIVQPPSITEYTTNLLRKKRGDSVR